MQVILKTLLFAVLLSRLHAAVVVASLSIPTFAEGETSNGWLRQTSTYDQAWNLTINTPNHGLTGEAGYLVFDTEMLIGFVQAYEPVEKVEGFGSVQVNSNTPIYAPYDSPTQTCSAVISSPCSIPFTFGVPFAAHLLVNMDVEYTYRGHGPQNLHGATSTIWINPRVYLAAGPELYQFTVDTPNPSFFIGSPTYTNYNSVVTEPPVAVSDVPEPSTLGLGLCGLGCLMFKRRKPTQP